MATVRQSYEVADHAEITMECNPGDVTPERAASWIGSGVNRISMGVQSFDDELLKLLGRRHTSREAAGAFRTLRESGFTNQSLDLMYGSPRSSPGSRPRLERSPLRSGSLRLHELDYSVAMDPLLLTIPLLLGTGVAAAVTPLVARLARYTGILDRPNPRNVSQRKNLPLLGGLAVAAGFSLALLGGKHCFA